MGSSNFSGFHIIQQREMKLTGLVLLALLGLCLSDTVDISPYVFRVKRSPQNQNPPTRIFTSNPNINSAAAGALVGGLLSFGQNQIFNPCTRNSNRNQNTNKKIFGNGFNFGSFVAGAAAGYGTSQLACNFLNGCG